MGAMEGGGDELAVSDSSFLLAIIDCPLTSSHRLTYAWVIADQEWSLFYDTPLSFSVDTLTESLPADDRLWKAGSESDWARLAPEAFATQPPICLRDLYTCFMNGELRPGRGTRLPLQYLRLLLVPLHGMVCHLRQWLQSFPNCPVRWRKSTQGLSNPAIHAQLDQVQALLPEWFNLAVHSANTNSPAGLAMLVKQLADEIGPQGSRVVGLMPGSILTDRLAHLQAASPATRAAAEASVALRRFGEPAEFAKVAAFLLSPAASYVTGSLVAKAEARGVDLPELSLGDMQAVHPAITAGVFDVLGVQNSVASRTSYGGTAPVRVREQISRWKERLR